MKKNTKFTQNILELIQRTTVFLPCDVLDVIEQRADQEASDSRADFAIRLIRDNIALGDRVQASAFAAVANDVPDGETVAGVPARPARAQMRAVAALERLPDLLKRVKELEARIRDIASAEDNP